MRGTGQGPSKPNSLLAALAPRDAPPAEAADARGTLATAIVFVAGAEVDWRAGEDLSVADDGACTRARGFGRDPVTGGLVRVRLRALRDHRQQGAAPRAAQQRRGTLAGGAHHALHREAPAGHRRNG